MGTAEVAGRQPSPSPVGTIVRMLYQHVRRSFWQRHPLVAAVGIVLTVWLLWHGAHVLVAVVGLAWLAIKVRKRSRANALRDAGLRARAEYEHRLNLSGDLRGVYGWMCGGLLITAVVAWFVSSSPALTAAIFGNRLVFWILALAQLGIVFTLSARVDRMASGTAAALLVA